MEVDHRAMNALALVKSFMQLSKTDTTAGYAAAVTGQVVPWRVPTACWQLQAGVGRIFAD